MTNQIPSFTATSHPNIALIKYWGKKDKKENIPTNPSISVTLTKLITTTTILETQNDEFILDGKKEKIPERMKKVIDLFKNKANYKSGLKIDSKNSFPHSCGLASSASGYSALVKALDGFFNLNISKKDLSKFARFGSGSASRSIFDGFVILKEVDKEFVSEKICDWKEIRVMVLILNSKIKKVPSTEGMIRTVETSTLFQKRLEGVEKKIQKMTQFVKERNFEQMALLTMKDSNEIHATCLDSFPPIFYLNEMSFGVVEMVNEINKDGIKVGYTFDAGSNAFLITKECFYEEVKSKFEGEFRVLEAL